MWSCLKSAVWLLLLCSVGELLDLVNGLVMGKPLRGRQFCQVHRKVSDVSPLDFSRPDFFTAGLFAAGPSREMTPRDGKGMKSVKKNGASRYRVLAFLR